MGVLSPWAGQQLLQEKLSGHGRQQDVVYAFCVRLISISKTKPFLDEGREILGILLNELVSKNLSCESRAVDCAFAPVLVVF